MKCGSYQEMVRYLDGELGPEQAAAMEAHLAECHTCSALREEIQLLTAGLAKRPGEFDDANLADDVLTLVRLGQAKEAEAERPAPLWQRWWPWLSPIAVGAAAAAVLLLAIHLPDATDPAFHAKSGVTHASDWVQLKIFRAGPQGYLPVQESIRPDDALAFAYANQSKGAYSHLLVLAVDERGEVYWYYPAHVDPRRDPQSIAICSDCATTALPDEVEHPLHPGLLRLFAVFSSAPLRVSAVERACAEGLAAAGGLAQLQQLDLDETAQQTMLLQVRRPAGDAGDEG